MPFEYNFLNRDEELYTLQDAFLNEVIKKKKCVSFLIRGRYGIGKSRLIHEFLNSIETDQRIAVNIPKLRRSIHAIEYECQKDSSEPYQPFMEIKEQMEAQQKGFRILKNSFMLMISLLPIHDVVDDLQKIVNEIKTGKQEDVIRAKETKTFAKYLKMLKKRSQRVPVLLCIQNVQWIDDFSLKLLQTLIENEDSFWGMIILEENESKSLNSTTATVFSRLYNEQKIKNLSLKLLQKGFEIKILEERLRPRLFTQVEFEHIYTLSEGCPGILAELVDDWIRKGWIYQDKSEWEKVADFENRIKVPYQKMLELLITLLQDGIISPREQILIDNFAQEWGVNKETVSGMIEMILKSREIGYEIIRRVHKGSIGEDAFLAQDKKMNKFIVEFVPNITFDKKEIVPPDISHPSLLVSKEIIKYEDGVLIVNEFFEGKTLREVNEEARETHTRKVLNVALQVAEGLEELHRNGLIHSYLRPESIIVTDESEIRLSALDANKLRITEPADTGKYLNTVSYFSPEQIKNQPLDQRSDIFSYGILIYELLTGERPFEGKNKGELKEAICYKDISFEESLKPAMSNDIRVVLEKCLQKNPDERYQNIKELINDLRNLFSKPGLEIDEKRTGKEEKGIKKFTAKPVPFLKRKKVLIPAAFVSLVVLALIVFKVFMSTSYRIVPNTIVVNHFIENRTPEQVNKFSSDMVEYLVIDDLLQSSKEQVFVFSEEDFDFIYGKENRIPELRITGDISLKNVAYEINCVLIKDGSANKKIPISFADPSALLKGYISNFTKKILTEMNKPGIKASAFTDRWEAFEKFYLGEKAWKKLEVTKAEQLFRSSLVYDQTFILAKLRLAQVLLFLGINLEAHELIHEIEAHKHKLSRFDSLRVEAVNARLGGDLFKEISILQDIYNGFPSRKEFTLDVAEAFYEICEIDKAIYYYKKSLLLDKNFAKAHNHMAYCYSHQGKHELALSHFRKYVQLDSTANAYDSMGDGYMTAGKLDSAEWAKKQGTLLNPELSYLWGSWGFINIRQGKLKQADKNFQKYFDLSQGENRKAVALYRKALTHYFRKDYSASLNQCLQAQALFDTTNIVTRNHDLHWLMGILHLKLNQDEKAKQELTQMEEIVKKHGINATNYRRGIYKYLIHLRACIAAKNNNVAIFKKCLEEFDGPIKNKIKDHGSPFDLAFFNTSFAELIMEYKILPIEHAEKRLKRALDYNPNYALGFYNLGRYFNKAADNNNANTQIRKFKELWKDAGKNVKMIYGL